MKHCKCGYSLVWRVQYLTMIRARLQGDASLAWWTYLHICYSGKKISKKEQKLPKLNKLLIDLSVMYICFIRLPFCKYFKKQIKK